jgi:hypothetical protein
MSDRTSIVIPRDVFERHNERRQDMRMTWVEYLNEGAPDRDAVDEDDIRSIVRDELERFESELRRR